jgi:L-ascorbate metabolism protein UlaG (beta-lactamase superfamily)
MGPKRHTEPPCAIGDIPIVDVVVISHSHYDHLSYPTIQQIQQTHPNVLFAVPLGLKKWFNDSGIQNVVELDWWQDVDIKLEPSTGATLVGSSATKTNPQHETIKARLSCLPCQHTSARTPFDTGHTLWASWAVSSPASNGETKSVYFGGDTGYRAVPLVPDHEDDYSPQYDHLPRCPAFREIGARKGPFDLALIPIGAYDPRHIFSSMHANPFDAVEIFKDVKARRAMGIHWGTWVLTEEDVKAPPRVLKAALARSGFAETGIFDVCDIGETREF